MTKLPVLYLSCETEALTGPKGQASLRRLIRPDLVVVNVAFITSKKGAHSRKSFTSVVRGFLPDACNPEWRNGGLMSPLAGLGNRV